MQENILKEIRNSEVEVRKIGEIFTLKNGYTPSKAKEEFWENGELPWFRLEDIRLNGRELSDAIQHITTLGIKGKLFPANSLIMSTTATIGEHALIKIPHLTNQQITNFSLKEEFKNKINIKFLFYCFFAFGKWSFKNANQSGTLRIIGLEKLAQYKISFPSLELQNKIVEILDKFSKATSELQTELKKEEELRKKQYEFYREKLLTFGDEVERKTLGEIGEFLRGSNLQKKDFTEFGIPAIHYGQIYTYYQTFTDKTITFVSEEFSKKSRKAKYGNLIIATTSENDEDLCKAVVWLGKEEVSVSNDACIYKHDLNPKYLAYFFQSEQFQKQKRNYITGTKVKRVNANDLAKILIPIPPIEKQKEIVKILDKFETLANSIKEGLPREIELRQKQYEYYRNLLLDFKE